MIVRGDVYDLGEVRYGDTDAVRSQALRAIEADGSAFPEDRHRGRPSGSCARSTRPWRPHRRHLVARLRVGVREGGRRSRAPVHRRRADGRPACRLPSVAPRATVPAPIDTTIIDTGAHSHNPFRQLATVKKITGTYWTGVSSAGVSASWDSEASEVSDDAPTLAQVQIGTHKGAAFVPFSIESGTGVRWRPTSTR